MKKNKKNNTQDTAKEENQAEDLRPDTEANSRADDMENAGTSAQPTGEANKESNQVSADMTAGEADRNTSGDFNNNNTSNNYSQEVDINAGGVALEKSPGATNKGNNPSNTDLAATPSDDREAIARSVDEDAEKQTGRPTGAIYGSGGDIITVSNPADSSTTTQKPAKASAKKRAAPAAKITRIYGQIHMDDNSYFIKAGNVPHGQLQLLAPKELEDQMAGYNGQQVSIAGELSKKNKADTYATFSIIKIVSHDQIGQRAYELSQQNPSSEEGNWLQAENELLQP